MINLSISGYIDVVCHRLKNIQVYACVCFFSDKMPRRILYLNTRLYPLLINVLSKVQAHTFTGDLQDEYFKNIIGCS